jgi:hypothetical protein
MSGNIPLVDRGRQVVVNVRWIGGIINGKRVVSAANSESKGIAQRVRKLIRERGDLKLVRFASVGPSGRVAGWSGFEGTLSALNVVLPTIGLWVQWDHVVWPDDKPDDEDVDGVII